ncbi:MAG: hypothetical protein ACI9HE_000591 [Planctomycetota bacterium]|jgi:hypothetical protein
MIQPLALLLLLALPQEPEQAPVLHEKVLLGEAHFATWDFTGRLPKVYPLLAPGGTPITREIKGPGSKPKQDHPHHVSFWTAHGDINGVDFWHDPKAKIKRQGDLLRKQDEEAQSTLLRQIFAWHGPTGKLLMRESRALHFHEKDGVRFVDRVHRFSAPPEEFVVFGDTKEGMFALRLRKELCPDGGGSLLNSEGQRDGKVWGQPARWIRYEGEIEGKTIGVAIFGHPDNRRHPTRWHARNYGLAAANPFGLHHFTGSPKGEGALILKPDESIDFRWRTAIYSGTRTQEQLETLWRDWSKTKH